MLDSTAKDLIYSGFAVESWIISEHIRPESIQTVVAQWTPAPQWGPFAAYDAMERKVPDACGYFGAVFDGRYVYFVPEMREDRTTHAVVLRYDTHAPFNSDSSYELFDASQVDRSIETRGFYGAAFDGKYVYFVPRQFDRSQYHSRLLRFDTASAFTDSAAWSVHDMGAEQSAQGCATDGKYIYFCPGYRGDPSKEDQIASRVLRYKTQCAFENHSSYELTDLAPRLGTDVGCFDGGAFDGRYIYFVPLGGPVVRFDSSCTLDDPAAWERFDRERIGMPSCVGAVFDGRYMYFCAYASARMARFDTRGDFASDSSWQVCEMDHIGGLRTCGFDGGFFDGRYVYFVPFVYGSKADGYTFHTNFLRYDTLGRFDDRASWSSRDGSESDGLRTIGYNAGAFDGRYFYAAPWRGGPTGDRALGVHGTILRYDTLDPASCFALRASDYGHNGGLCAALRGPTFLVNMGLHVVSASRPQPLSVGLHHLVGEYNGTEMRLYIDGQLAAKRTACGMPVRSSLPATVGKSHESNDRFDGQVISHRLFEEALGQTAVRERFNAGPQQ